MDIAKSFFGINKNDMKLQNGDTRVNDMPAEFNGGNESEIQTEKRELIIENKDLNFVLHCVENGKRAAQFGISDKNKKKQQRG